LLIDLLDMWAVFILVLLSFSGFAAYWWQGVLVGAVVVGVSLPDPVSSFAHAMIDSSYRFAPRHGRLIVKGRRTLRAMQSLNSLRMYADACAYRGRVVCGGVGVVSPIAVFRC
jgi:hypothetical protein